MHDRDLDDLFSQAHAVEPLLPSHLVARIEADALAEQRARATAARRPAPTARRGWTAWLAALGGGGVVAGLATATLAGVWLGVAQPAPVSALTQKMSDAFLQNATLEQVELIPNLDAFVTEG